MMTKDINNSQQKLVVLIDADNASPSIIYGLMAEIAKYGTAHVKRIYGDWTSPNLKGWKDILLEHALQPVQQFGYTKGKNSTDSAMIIDAMDLLYSSKFDGFCIVSSDSDFTRLASRIREGGLNVYGFGEQKPPQPCIGEVGQHITKQSPEFDARNYGYAKLKDLVKSIQLFEIDERKDERAPNIKQIYIKDKRIKNSL